MFNGITNALDIQLKKQILIQTFNVKNVKMKKQPTFDQRAHILFPHAHKGFFKTAYVCTAKQEEVRRYIRFLDEVKKTKIAPSLKERKLAVLNNEIRAKNSARKAQISKNDKNAAAASRKPLAKPLPRVSRISKVNTKDIVQKLLAPNIGLLMKKAKKKGYIVPNEVLNTHRRAY